jgi:methylated-DNA-[protein]-cysteine S-methyltransferase
MSKRAQNKAIDPGAELRHAARGVDAAAAAALLTERAEDEGLLDVAYTVVDSPFGPLVLAATRRGLVKVSFGQESPEKVVEELSAEISPRVLEAPARLDEVQRELDLYFDGRLKDFEVPLDWQLTRGFYRKVLRATSRVPYGEVSTYSEVAAKAGNPRAFRAAGTALGSNPLPIIVPCHRILQSGGGLGGYGGGLEMKQRLLKLEGAL